MEKHISFLKTCCRLCGNIVKGKSDQKSFKQELWLKFQIKVKVDREDIQPTVICPACELGFVSEPAQKFVRKESDHRKTMSVL